MAFVVTPDEKAPQAQGAQAIAAPTSTGGAGTAGAAKATTKAANTPGVNSPAQPSAQLSAYLNANQQQAGAMAGNISNTVGGQINAAGQAILPAVNTYTGQLTNVAPDSALNTQLANSPASLTADQQAAYQKELNAASQKPNSAATFETTQAYGDLTGNIQKATEQAALWNAGNNVAQLQTAITPFEGANATTGDRQLDALLLSQTPGAYSQIQRAVAPAATLQDQLTQATTQANTGLKTAIANDTASTQAAQQAAQTYAKNLTDYLVSTQNADTSAQNTVIQQEQQLLNAIKSQILTPEQISALGMTKDQYDSLSAQLQLAENPQQITSPVDVLGYRQPGYSTAADFWGRLSGDRQSQFEAYNPYTARTVNVSTDPTKINLADYLKQSNTPSQATLQNIATGQNYTDVAALLNMYPGVSGLPIGTDTAAQAGTYTIPTLNGLNQYNYQGALDAATKAAQEGLAGGNKKANDAAQAEAASILQELYMLASTQH